MKAQPGRVVWRTNGWFRVLRYGFCPDRDAFERERARVLKSCHIDIAESYPVSSRIVGMTLLWKENGEPHALICLDDSLDDNPVKLVATIAHECVHVAQAIIDAMSEERPGEEFSAHLVGALSGEIFSDYSMVRSPKAKADRA